MKRVFLDTNILLDYGLDRELADYAGSILELGRRGLIELTASYLSFANMGYILRHHPIDEIYQLIRMMRQPVEVLPCNAAQLDAGLITGVKDFEDVIRTAVSLGGDCDTLTCIAGSMAEAFYGVPEDIYQEGYNRLDTEMKDVLNQFYSMISRECNE